MRSEVLMIGGAQGLVRDACSGAAVAPIERSLRMSLQEPEPNGRRPSLRLYHAADGEADDSHRLSPAMTLTEFSEIYVLPVYMRMKDSSPRTIDEYRQSLKYWREFSADPPLEEIDQWLCAEFVEQLKRLPGRKTDQCLSPNTIRKHCIQLQHCLDLAGPQSRQHRCAQGLLEQVPYLERPSAWYEEVEKTFEIEEIDRWLGVCWHAKVPRISGVSPTAWWSALIIYIYNVGIRINTALQIRWEMHRRDDRQRLWLHVPPGIIKQHRGEKFYVNIAAAEAMESIRSQRELIFPWPHHRRYLDTVRVKLLTAAGIPPERRFGFHALRGAMCTEAAEKNPMVAQKQAGHLGIAMTRDAYVNKKVVAETMEKLPQPRGRRRRKDDPRQQRLFD